MAKFHLKDLSCSLHEKTSFNTKCEFFFFPSCIQFFPDIDLRGSDPFLLTVRLSEDVNETLPDMSLALFVLRMLIDRDDLPAVLQGLFFSVLDGSHRTTPFFPA